MFKWVSSYCIFLKSSVRHYSIITIALYFLRLTMQSFSSQWMTECLCSGFMEIEWECRSHTTDNLLALQSDSLLRSQEKRHSFLIHVVLTMLKKDSKAFRINPLQPMTPCLSPNLRILVLIGYGHWKHQHIVTYGANDFDAKTPKYDFAHNNWHRHGFSFAFMYLIVDVMRPLQTCITCWQLVHREMI